MIRRFKYAVSTTRSPLERVRNMPLTKLDAAPALVVIDLQKGIIALPTVHPIDEIVSRAAQLARAFRERSLPVVLVNVRGVAPGRTDAERPNLSRPGDWSDLVPELKT